MRERDIVRLMLSIAHHGWHSSAWRVNEAFLFQPRSLIDAAVRAEQANFDAVIFGMPDPQFKTPGDGTAASVRFDALPVMGAAIGATKRIGLCAYWPLDVAEPFHVARVMASLDHLSGGRVGWVAGLAGRDNLLADYAHMPLLAEPEAAHRAAEFISVVRELCDSWDDEAYVADQASGRFVDPDRVRPIMHNGSYFTVRGPLNVPRPIQGHPVLVLHECGSEALRAAVLPLVDVLICDLPTPDQAAQFRAQVRSGFRSRHLPSVRSSSALVIKTAMPILGRTEREALQRADELAALGTGPSPFFVGTPAGLAAELAKWLAHDACDGFDLRPAVNAHDLDLICEAVASSLRPASRRSSERPSTLRESLRIARPSSRIVEAIQ
jgi:alkanesulfonate monooxygenase SsuD/methylene tetrahydromethanopterin reductase-like flavin-dependent oxidoreductase (luciferase family)